MHPKVSVVIPIYNVNKEYLDICLESVMNQSYKNLEIILVDDGSEERCRRYCDTLAGKDYRIKVIHKENKGVSEARNTGTKEATGEYVTYVDADDIIAPYAIEHGVAEIEKNDVDMAVGAVQKIHEISQFQVNKSKTSYDVDLLHADRFGELRLLYLNDPKSDYVGIEGAGYINRAPYCRIIKTSIAKRNMFPIGFPIGEDVIWNMSLLNECHSVCVIKEIWYGYMIYQNSAIRKYYGNREELARKYLQRLYEQNKDFCSCNMKSFIKNMAIEFYCILNQDLMSEKCPMGISEKKKTVREYLQNEPWNMLCKKENRKGMPLMYKILCILCPSGLWIDYLRFYKLVKH